MSTDVKISNKVAVTVKPPGMWKVIFLNDDHTPMDFVILLLTTIFKHSVSSANDVTLEIHNTGSGIAGVYSHEVAEQRGIDASHLAKEHNYPLQIMVEEE